MKLWSHHFSQTMKKKLSRFLPCSVRAEILTIFRLYFWRNDDFWNSFWNLLTFNFERSVKQKGRLCVASNPHDFREEGEKEEIINLDIFLLNTNGILMVETIIGPLRLHPEQKRRGIMLQIMHSVGYFHFFNLKFGLSEKGTKNLPLKILT